MEQIDTYSLIWNWILCQMEMYIIMNEAWDWDNLTVFQVDAFTSQVSDARSIWQ